MIPVLTVIIESLWFLPLFLRQGRKDAAPKRFTVFAFFMGAVPGTVLAVFLGRGIALCDLFGLDRTTGAGLFLFCLVNAGLAEEFAKFFCGWLILLIAKPKRKLDYILILGGSAMGFALLESFLYASSSAVALFRCLIPTHLMWQMMMGEHYFECLKAGKEGNGKRAAKEALIGFGIPVLMHTVNDYIVFEATNIITGIVDTENITAAQAVFGLVIPVVFIFGTFVFCIWEEKRAAGFVKESRLADIQEKEEQ